MHGSYSTIAWGASVHKGKLPDVDYEVLAAAATASEKALSYMAALGDVAFAYAGHNVVLEIQATIPSTPETPSKKPMWRGVVVAYAMVAACYFPVSLLGYWAFGNQVDDNVLVTLTKPRWLIALANAMVVVHVIGSYQVLCAGSLLVDTDYWPSSFSSSCHHRNYMLAMLSSIQMFFFWQIFARPVFDMMETVLVKKLHFPPGLALRLIARSTYVGNVTHLSSRLNSQLIVSSQFSFLTLKYVLQISAEQMDAKLLMQHSRRS
jgi:hypothetical protein